MATEKILGTYTSQNGRRYEFVALTWGPNDRGDSFDIRQYTPGKQRPMSISLGASGAAVLVSALTAWRIFVRDRYINTQASR